jgi:tRNA(fMet)-specific endonuclease VapC
VIYPDEATFALSAKINAALAVTGKTIGVPDTFIAATAITRNLTLVNANTKHFSRIQTVGFPITL